MRQLSIRLKMTLWFATVSIIIVAVTYAIVVSASNSVMQKTIQDNLIETVENNVDEVEYYNSMEEAEDDQDGDQYIVYGGGVLEIDDDFLDQVNGISTSLYLEDNALLYGANPIAREIAHVSYINSKLQKQNIGGTTWYIYDRKLNGNGLGGLWLRGVVSSEQGTYQLSSIIRTSLILMPIIMAFGILGGYLIAGKTLRPIKKITETAAQIGQGKDLKRRINLGDGKDEVHQLASTFDEMFNRLDSSFEAERRFTSDASHELRTPMSVIMAQCEFYLEKERSPEEYQEALQVIRRQGRKMSRLIDDMLIFTRLERKAESYAMEPINLSELVAFVCQDMAYISEKNISLQYQVQPDISIKGNYDLLTRLLTNLLTNAYRYGRENGHIMVTLIEDSKIRLVVEDDGIGIAPEEIDKIFERFYQVDRSRSNVGTGLGLAMVREIAELHNGDIAVESVLGRGSKFTFTT